MLNRTQAPASKAVDGITLIKPGHIKLKNGANLFHFNADAQDLVRIEWIFGNLRFDATKPLLNMAANTLLTSGTNNATAAQIAEQIDFYGAFLQNEYGYDQSTVTLYSLNKHLESVLPVISDILSNSIFPEKELETFKLTHQQKLQIGLQKNDILARRQFNRAIYGNNAYGFSAEVSDYQSINRSDLQDNFRQQYQPSNCTIIVAGKVTEEILNLLLKTFGNEWTSTAGAADTSQPAIEQAAEKTYFIDRPDAIQSAIRIGKPSINRKHPDFPGLQVLNTVFGGYFGSRLMANIREDKGYTYGIGSAMSSLKYTGALFMATEVGADVCRAAVNEIEKEVNLLKSELIPDDELALVRNYMLGSLLGSLENVMSHADKFKNLYFGGLDYDYYDRYTETIKTITSQQLQQLAQQYFDWDSFYKVVAGKW